MIKLIFCHILRRVKCPIELSVEPRSIHLLKRIICVLIFFVSESFTGHGALGCNVTPTLFGLFSNLPIQGFREIKVCHVQKSKKAQKGKNCPIKKKSIKIKEFQKRLELEKVKVKIPIKNSMYIVESSPKFKVNLKVPTPPLPPPFHL